MYIRKALSHTQFLWYLFFTLCLFYFSYCRMIANFNVVNFCLFSFCCCCYFSSFCSLSALSSLRIIKIKFYRRVYSSINNAPKNIVTNRKQIIHTARKSPCKYETVEYSRNKCELGFIRIGCASGSEIKTIYHFSALFWCFLSI